MTMGVGDLWTGRKVRMLSSIAELLKSSYLPSISGTPCAFMEFIDAEAML